MTNRLYFIFIVTSRDVPRGQPHTRVRRKVLVYQPAVRSRLETARHARVLAGAQAEKSACAAGGRGPCQATFGASAGGSTRKVGPRRAGCDVARQWPGPALSKCITLTRPRAGCGRGDWAGPEGGGGPTTPWTVSCWLAATAPETPHGRRWWERRRAIERTACGGGRGKRGKEEEV